MLLAVQPLSPSMAPRAGGEEVPSAGARSPVMEGILDPSSEQVRIERQSVIVRIAPRASRQAMSRLYNERAPTFRERKMSRCVPIGAIAGVQITPDSRLLLFMRDQRLISASLDKACNTDDFYSGFYLERSKDGLLCTGRDELRARTGAHCPVSRMRELVPR